VRIVAVEQFGAGPFGTLHLADLGAEIIRIEDPGTGGDVSRYMAPGQQGSDSLYFDSFNRGKRSLILDLKNPAGQEVLHRLVRHAHAVYANLRGDVVKGLGLTYETLGKVNPAVVCVTLSAYGRDGARSSEPGYDPATGLLYLPAEGFDLPPVPDAPSTAEVEAALAQPAPRLLIEKHASTESNDAWAAGEEVLDRVGLAPPELGLLVREETVDRPPGGLLDVTVSVVERASEHFGQKLTERRLTHAHEPRERDRAAVHS